MNQDPVGRLLRGACGHSPDAAAAAWLAQARRLLASAGLPTDVATVQPARNGRPVTIEVAAEVGAETATAVLEWALEASSRVLRGAPQPSRAEVYKAGRALRSQMPEPDADSTVAAAPAARGETAAVLPEP